MSSYLGTQIVSFREDEMKQIKDLFFFFNNQALTLKGAAHFWTRNCSMLIPRPTPTNFISD